MFSRFFLLDDIWGQVPLEVKCNLRMRSKRKWKGQAATYSNNYALYSLFRPACQKLGVVGSG